MVSSRLLSTFVALMVLFSTSSVRAQGTPSGTLAADYEMAVLPDLGSTAAALDVNEHGQIVGWGSVPGLEGDVALYWPSDGAFEVLPTAIGGNASAHAINDDGQIVGRAEDARGFVRPVTWIDGEMSDLGTLGGANGEAAGINNAGQIVGWSETATGEQHATLWQSGTPIDLEIPYGDTSRALDINGRGEIVGSAWFVDVPSHPERPFHWVDGELADLGDLGGGGVAIAINDAGQVTGHARHPEASNDEPMRGRAFLRQDGRLSGLDGLPDGWSWGVDVNVRGQVSGLTISQEGTLRAFTWHDGVVAQLGSPPGASNAMGLNDQGLAVGMWQETADDFASQNAAVWRPVEMSDA